MNSILWLLGYLRRYRLRIVIVCFLLVAVAVMELIMPWIIRLIVDDILPQGNYSALALLALAVLAIAAIRGAANFTMRYNAQKLSERVAYDVRNQLYQSLERQSFKFYDQNPTGQLISRATSDIDSLRRFLGWALINILGILLRFAGIFIILLLWEPRLTLLALSPAPIILYLALRFSRIIRPASYAVQTKLGALTVVLQENIAGVRIVRAFASEEYEKEKFRKANQEYADSLLAAARIRSRYMPLMDMIVGLSTVLIIFYGGNLVVSGALSLGSFIAFTGYLTIILNPLRFLGFLTSTLQEAMAGMERVFDVIDAQPDVIDSPDAIELKEVKGRIVFENVSFQYPNGPVALRGVNFEVKPNETVALLGPTGSGKSTIIQLIPRFYDVTSGRIMIDGHDVRKIKVASLRKHIGIVLQDTFLFTGTIRENIAYGRPDATMEEIIEAAKAAEADSFIRALPEGYETRVGERGVNLSGGQRQRIAIARALLMNPRILILDDSTSSVDVDTEYLIQKALRRLMRGRTNFIITHRISTVRGADKILVIENGELVEFGTHEELLARGGLYAKLYYTQLGGQPAEAVTESTGG